MQTCRHAGGDDDFSLRPFILAFSVGLLPCSSKPNAATNVLNVKSVGATLFAPLCPLII